MSSAQYSLLRWAGSKRQLIPILSKYWNSNYRTYIEPFAGSAQLFFAVDSIQNGVLGDKNGELIEMYQQIKKSPYEVYRVLKELENTQDNYYRIRSTNPRSLGINQRAARFIYLNWLCFNGLYRTNKDGVFNVPYSGNKEKKIDNWHLIKNASRKLQSATLVTGDFENVVCNYANNKSLIYLDPPYAIENERIFTQYGNSTFGLNDLDRLNNLLDEIDCLGAKFVLSYIHTDVTLTKFSKWDVQFVEVQRNISGFSRHRRKSKEILISNIN